MRSYGAVLYRNWTVIRCTVYDHRFQAENYCILDEYGRIRGRIVRPENAHNTNHLLELFVAFSHHYFYYFISVMMFNIHHKKTLLFFFYRSSHIITLYLFSYSLVDSQKNDLHITNDVYIILSIFGVSFSISLLSFKFLLSVWFGVFPQGLCYYLKYFF